jgi:hypothetical protein
MLVELKAFIPKDWKVYVLFDSWYAEREVTQVHSPTGQELAYFVRD